MHTASGSLASTGRSTVAERPGTGFKRIRGDGPSPAKPADEEDPSNLASHLMPADSFSCEELWRSRYALDLPRYSSFSLWAETALAEAGELVKSRTLPSHVLTGMAAQMLIEMEGKLRDMYGPEASDVFDTVLNSVYRLRGPDGNPTCESARKVIERNVWVSSGEEEHGELEEGGGFSPIQREEPREQRLPRIASPGPPGSPVGGSSPQVRKHAAFGAPPNPAGYKARLGVFMQVPTYYDEIRFLWGNLKKEIVVRPPCHRKMQAMRAERVSETRAIDRACTFWNRGKMMCMFQAWKQDASMEADREKRGKFMMMMVQLKVGDVFKAWLKVHKEEQALNIGTSVLEAKAAAESAKVDIKRLNYENSKKIPLKAAAQDLAQKAKRRAVDAKVKLDEPARQTPILKRIVQK